MSASPPATAASPAAAVPSAAQVPPASWPDTGAIIVRELGRSDYAETLLAMQAFTDARDAATPDEIWITEHAPIYTLGLAGRREHLLRDNGIATLKVDRGGQVTYHGPGQLVMYLLFDLRRPRIGVRELVRRIETGVINWLGTLGIRAFGDIKAPGVYVHDAGGRNAKIAALGLKIRHGCCYHGVAVNFDMDLAPFHDIDPCGYPGLAVAQVADFGVDIAFDAAGRALAMQLARALQGGQIP